MTPRIIILLAGILFCLSISTVSAIQPKDVDCSAGATFCAASCARQDVQDAADQAMASGLADTTLYIPACTATPYPWTAGEKLVLKTDPSKAIRLIGSGRETTHIKHFQIDVPESTKLNLVEFGHISVHGGDTIGSMLDYRLRPETLNKELYWHHFSVAGYTSGYTLTFEGWLGVVHDVNMTCRDNGPRQNAYGITVHGDGVYNDHTVDFGTRNAFFIENSTFDSCSHTVSTFCDGYVVFRNNSVINADSHTDLHGPGYNYCYYNPEEKTAGGGMELYDNQFTASQGNWVINARAGSGHIYTNNRFDSDDYQILLYWDAGSSKHGRNCGTGAGQTCGRCYDIGCEGCCQAQENTYIWDNDGTVREYIGGGASDCLIENQTYFLRAPNLAQDGFTYSRFVYPHPQAKNDAAPPNDDKVVVVSELTRDNIQNAIRQVAAGGGKVYLPSGTLHDAGNIDTVNGVEIIGSCTNGPPCAAVMNVRDPQTHKWGPLPTTVFTGTVTFRGNNPFSSDPAPVYNATDPDKLLRISAIRFNTKEGNLIATRGAKLFRFDHIDFDYPEKTCSPTVLRYVASIDQELAADSAYDAYAGMGVIDHNNSFCGDYMWYLGPRLRGDQCTQLGAANTDPTGYPDAIYLEDNYFEDFGHPVASFGSVNYVVRHNYFTARAATGGWEYGLDAHGPGYHEIWGENYGGCVTEMYNNTFTQEGLDWAGTHIRLRSGRGVIYNNTIENSGYPGRFVAEDCNRSLSMGLDQCFDTPHEFYMWDNRLNNVSESQQFNIEANCGACIGPKDLNENTPMPGYTAYEYPHRLVSDGTVPNPPTSLKLIVE